MIEIECPSCLVNICLSDTQLQNEDLICDCGYLIFLDEMGVKPLRIIVNDEMKKCS